MENEQKISDYEENISQSEISIKSQIAEIDALISLQLNEILHHEEFQTLEASWRGLHYLVIETQPNQYLKIKVLYATKKDLLKDFERAVEFDQSFLFKKVHDDIYGTFGENPFGMLIGDYEFGNHPQDMVVINNLAKVAATAHTPFISAASAHLFQWDNFSEMYETRDISRIFDQLEYSKWRSFRESEDSRYVGLCLPHILLREQYQSVSSELFNFQEFVEPKMLLWGNAAYAFGACVAKAYRESSWCGLMLGPESDGLVEGLFDYENGLFDQSIDVLIEARREKEFADLGFIPLIENPASNETAFFSNQSCNKPRRYDTAGANNNALLSAQLPYVFAMSRFAHYLKAIVRDRSKPFANRQECQNALNQWLLKYYQPMIETGVEIRSRFPLSDTRIDLTELPAKPDEFKGVAFLLPAYQLGDLLISLRMVIHLPKNWQNLVELK